MVVGVMAVHLALHDNESLKGKRSVLKRLIQRSKNTFNVSAAEVDDQDALNKGVLGFVAVGSDKVYVEGLLQKLETFIERAALADVLRVERTIEHY